MMGGTLLLSYSFIWQPAYDTPRSEIITDSKSVIYEMTPNNTFILTDSDGRYYLVSENEEDMDEISKKYAQKMIKDGFSVRNID